MVSQLQDVGQTPTGETMKKDKTETPTSPADKYEAFLKRNLCTFQTAGRRCQIIGGHIDHGPKYRLCDWHWLNQSTPQFLQNREEFLKFREVERKTYPKEWSQASVCIDDDLAWACTLGKEQQIEFARAVRVIENECDEEVFGRDGRGPKKHISDHPPSPEVSVKEYENTLPF